VRRLDERANARHARLEQLDMQRSVTC
jgi:hypothetical protein